MSSDVVFTAVRDLLAERWTLAPIVFPNEGESGIDPSAPWIYCDASGSLVEPMELGGRAWIEVGTIYLHVHVPVGTGTLEVRSVAKALSNLFRDARSYGGVVFGDHSLGMGEMGDDDGMYWRQSLTVSYKYQDIGV